MDGKLNSKETLQIIRLYKSHPVLWDMNHKSYRRKDLKYKAYKSIADEMGMEYGFVKTKIRSLRITYTAEKRKMNRRNTSAEENYTPSLWWFNEMSFLDSSIITRKVVDNEAEKFFFEEVYCESQQSPDEESLPSESKSTFQPDVPAKSRKRTIEECNGEHINKTTRNEEPQYPACTERERIGRHDGFFAMVSEIFEDLPIDEVRKAKFFFINHLGEVMDRAKNCIDNKNI